MLFGGLEKTHLRTELKPEAFIFIAYSMAYGISVYLYMAHKGSIKVYHMLVSWRV